MGPDRQRGVRLAPVCDLHAVRSLFVHLALIGPLVANAQDTLPEVVRAAQQALKAASPEQHVLRELDLSAAYRSADMLDSSRALADRALRDARDDSERSRAHFEIARVLFEEQDNTGVQEHARQAIVLARAAKDTATWLRGEGILGEVDQDLDRFAAARTHAVLVRELAYATGDTTAMVASHTTLGNLFYMQENYDSARWHYDRSIALIPKSQPRNRLVARLNQVNLFIEEGRYDSAMARSDAMRAEIGLSDATIRSKYHNQRGYALFNAGRFREAIPEFALSDSLNNAEVKELDVRIENTGFLAESYAAIGDSARAYLLMRDLEVLKDSLNRTATDERMLALEKQFETRLNKEEIQRLDGENKQKEERIRAQNVQLYGSLALAALALGGVLLVWRNLRQKRRHAGILEALNTELKDQKDRIEEINRLLQLKVLRTQMNPHFIYNSLNAIANLVKKGDSVSAGAYLDGFARLLRMVLDHSVRDSVPLEDEIAFLRQYLKMEALRFEDGLSYSVDADPALLNTQDDVLVPTLLIQPFVENAVWHGLAPKQGEKKLQVRFSQHEGKLTCTVEDNGVGRKAAPKRAHPDGSASVGLQLTNERLQLLSYKLEGTGRVVFTDLADGDVPLGTRVEVILSGA
jgi:tetratricopeptide (TPR) repeat protein